MRHLAAWRDAPFYYPSDFICRKSAERLDSMANKPSDPGPESVCKLQRFRYPDYLVWPSERSYRRSH